jgi:protein tyrosine phosphatase (PTP) superfamily phosphohydrolase (DUF442 family)
MTGRQRASSPVADLVVSCGQTSSKILRVIVAILFLAAPAVGAERLDAPNVVEISPTLVTSGQPTVNALRSLAAQGFEAVIYLAPSTVPDAIAEEPALLKSQGIEFIHIPVPFMQPTESHVAQLSAALERLKAKRVLVHCQVNMRASTLVFLHRVIVNGEDPALAYEAVARVWSPRGPWKTLVLEQLRRHWIAFEPF